MEDIPSSDYPSFDDVIDSVLNLDLPLESRGMARFSDLLGSELAQLEEIWESIPVWRRQELLEILEQLFEEDTLLSFEAVCRIALEDQSPQIRFVAVRSLQEYEVPDLIPTFLDFVTNDEDEELRAIAASTLGRYIYLGEIDKLSREKLETIENSLLQVVREESSHLICCRALESLGFSSREEVPGLIDEAFKSSEEYWIRSALFSMGRSCDDRWESKIMKMLSHTSAGIRFEAIRAAGEIEIANAKPQLLNNLEDENREIRFASALALSKIGGEGLVGVFENLINQSTDEGEIQIIEDAIDNLIFNQSFGNLEVDED
jgi:hypothetical protein